MLGQKFDIIVRSWKDSSNYKMNVEVIHVSDQVLRFRIIAGSKEMIMQKILSRKKSPWKIQEMNFEFKGDTKDSAMNLMRIQDAIDFYFNKNVAGANG